MFGIAGFPGDLLAGNKNIDHQVLRSKLTHETHRNTTQAVGVRYVWYLIMNIMGRFFLKLQVKEDEKTRFIERNVGINLKSDSLRVLYFWYYRSCRCLE
ncbi:hypothetical protein GLYMA_07G123300v4 [Glycine max]|nr:hypothetical protein GLYMA_07G123300v4 [Glycine max]KAG4400759.1 hypothetical protein GLYMA_07G123300v4 [Glycine max]KAH1086546.1 hypothetical protein GYH30_018183 [Glycine max]KAH1086547.1 hypothetical protein GYH30_018183 [Glycine max]